MNHKILVPVSIVFSIVFIVIATIYWMTPAGQLPHYMPGFISGSTAIHFKHGLGSLILALALLAYAWFKGCEVVETK